MNRLWVIFFLVLALVARAAVPSLADMSIHLNDERSTALPLEPPDVDSMSFGGNAHPGR